MPLSPGSSLKTLRNNEDSLEGESNQVKRGQWWDLVARIDEQIKDERKKLERKYEAIGRLLEKGLQGEEYYRWITAQAEKLEASIKKLEYREASYRESANNEQARRANTSSREFMLKGTVPNGFSYWKYKGNLYKYAANLQGYSMKCEYEKTGISDLAPEGQLTSNSSLVVELYFKTRERAVDMCNKWEKHRTE